MTGMRLSITPWKMGGICLRLANSSQMPCGIFRHYCCFAWALGKEAHEKEQGMRCWVQAKSAIADELIKVIGCWYAQQRKCAPSASDWTIFCHESAAAAAAVATAAAASAEISIKYRVIQPRRSQCCRLRTRLCVATKTKETVFKLAWNISGELLGTGPESRRSFEGHCRP